ncbi:bifunctional ADP-dependent NAD(P)H-hydrate dehydratase/NAD(P)H-hydrate epimerase [soil metagenome]
MKYRIAGMNLPAADGIPLHDTAALRMVERRAGAASAGGAGRLMQCAGLAAWQHLLQHWPQAHRITVACGPGNNGGDGYVLARHARAAGREVRVLRLPAHAPRSALAQEACQAYLEAGGRVDDFNGDLDDSDLVVDALFGIGLSRAPDGPTEQLITAINAAGVDVFALDAPSGVDVERGCVPGEAVFATRTLEFLAAHAGLRTGEALEHVGDVSLAALDVAADAWAGIVPIAHLLCAADLATLQQPRRRNAHKGDGGHVLCIGGDDGKGGAILLAAEAALRAGSGLVSVATRAQHVPALLARRPEAMALAVDSATDLGPLVAAAGVIAVGPGLGQGRWGGELLTAALAAGMPLVLDADALNLLALARGTTCALPQACVLTPHPGEAARLLGCTTAQVQADRYGAARALCAAWGCAVVLKGAGTLVAAPGSHGRTEIAVIGAGNPGMAVGGMGDVLTGTIAALLARGFDAFAAARFGALLHAAAGDRAAAEGGERGLLPADLMLPLRRLSNPPA